MAKFVSKFNRGLQWSSIYNKKANPSNPTGVPTFTKLFEGPKRATPTAPRSALEKAFGPLPYDVRTKQWRNYGLFADDLENAERPEVTEALKRLHPDVQQARFKRIKIAFDLFIKQEHAPPHLRPTDETDKSYLQDLIFEVSQEHLERKWFRKPGWFDYIAPKGFVAPTHFTPEADAAFISQTSNTASALN